MQFIPGAPFCFNQSATGQPSCFSFHVVFFQLEEVMETETYKNAKVILERFDPEAKKKAVRTVVIF